MSKNLTEFFSGVSEGKLISIDRLPAASCINTSGYILIMESYNAPSVIVVDDGSSWGAENTPLSNT